MTGPVPSNSDIDRFANSLDVARDLDSAHYDRPGRNTSDERHEALMTAFEELSVAGEELRAQQETLVETSNLLEIQRNRYHTLFDFAPDPYLVTDGLGTIEEANAAASELFGVPGKMLVGKSLATFVDARARPEFRSHLEALGHGVRADKWMIETKVREGRLVSVRAADARAGARARGRADRAQGGRSGESDQVGAFRPPEPRVSHAASRRVRIP